MEIFLQFFVSFSTSRCTVEVKMVITNVSLPLPFYVKQNPCGMFQQDRESAALRLPFLLTPSDQLACVEKTELAKRVACLWVKAAKQGPVVSFLSPRNFYLF